MGNTTSKEDTLTTPSNNPKCYYTLLGLTPTATLADLRSSYRRLALLHHPDKNPGKEDEATQSFAQIQHAYQVLSDPQERAWYDRIRMEQQHHHHTNKSNRNRWDTEDVMRLFEADVFIGYDDNPKGFFSIFRQVFEHLEGLEDAADDEMTYFGSLNTPFEPAIKAFYDKWLGFNSRRTDFVVPNDPYFEHYQQGVNRRDRRYLEKERDKQKDLARKEYSEAVRNLAAYVHKRDPRYKTYLLQKKKANQEQEELRKRQAKEAKRQTHFVQQDWAKLTNEEEELLKRLEELEILSDDDSKEELEEFYCVACRKTFKSQKQWKNHEQSKKHLSELEKFKNIDEDDMQNGVEESEQFFSEDIDENSGIESFEPPQMSSLEEVTEEIGIKVNSNPTSYEESQQKPPKKKDRAKKQIAKSDEPKQPKLVTKPRRNKDKADKEQIRCTSCKEIFESRNQLFTHLKETGHAKATK